MSLRHFWISDIIKKLVFPPNFKAWKITFPKSLVLKSENLDRLPQNSVQNWETFFLAVAPKGALLCPILVLFKEKYLTILSWRNQMRTCKDYRHRCACVARDPSAPVEMAPDGPSTRLLAYPLVSCVSLSDWSCVFEAKVVWSSGCLLLSFLF